jgi:hypothetical protein
MKFRLLAFIPPAIFVTMLLFVSASSLVSALEVSLTPSSISMIPIMYYESDCPTSEMLGLEQSACRTKRREPLDHVAPLGPATFVF